MNSNETSQALAMIIEAYCDFHEKDAKIFENLDVKSLKTLSNDLFKASSALERKISRNDAHKLCEISSIVNRISEKVQTLFEIPDAHKENFINHDEYMRSILKDLLVEENRLKNLGEREDF